jgi:hypothetical protein
VHFVRHFRKARYDVEPHSKLLCKIAHDAKRVVRGDAFPPWSNATQRCISRTHDQNQTPCSTIIPRHRVACDTDM